MEWFKVASLLGRFSSSMLVCLLLKIHVRALNTVGLVGIMETADGKVAKYQLVYVNSRDNSAKVKPRVRHAHGGADLMLRAARASVLGIAT